MIQAFSQKKTIFFVLNKLMGAFLPLMRQDLRRSKEGYQCPKSHKSVFFLQTSWPLFIKCRMIKEHNDIGFSEKKPIFFILDKPMGEKEGEILPFSVAVEGCICQVSMPKIHQSAFFLQTSWPHLIKCCMIKAHNDLGF